MALLPLTTCAQLLGIHPKTLHSWLKEANLPLAVHPNDARIKCLQEHHLREIAGRHDRPLPPQAQAAVVCEEPVSSRSLTATSEPDMMHKLSDLETKVASLHEQLTRLALALLAEREQTLEHRIATLERLLTEQTASTPPLPQRQMTVPTFSPVAVVPVPRVLNPAELRAQARLLPLIEYGAAGAYVVVCPHEGELALLPDSPEWFTWFATLSSFRFVGQSGRFTAYRETKHHRPSRSWRAVRSIHDHNYKHHLGVTDHLTVAHLEQAAAKLQAYMTSL